MEGRRTVSGKARWKAVEGRREGQREGQREGAVEGRGRPVERRGGRAVEGSILEHAHAAAKLPLAPLPVAERERGQPGHARDGGGRARLQGIGSGSEGIGSGSEGIGSGSEGIGSGSEGIGRGV